MASYDKTVHAITDKQKGQSVTEFKKMSFKNRVIDHFWIQAFKANWILKQWHVQQKL